MELQAAYDAFIQDGKNNDEELKVRNETMRQEISLARQELNKRDEDHKKAVHGAEEIHTAQIATLQESYNQEKVIARIHQRLVLLIPLHRNNYISPIKPLSRK